MSDDWRNRRYCGSPEVDEASGTSSEEGFLPKECCDSCHDDINDGYQDYFEADLPGGLLALVCCRISTRMEEREGQAP